MTSVSNNVHIDKLDNIVNKYNNTYYNTIKMKPIDVKFNTCTDFGIENNDKNPKFEVDNHVRISKYKNILVKGYTPNWSKEVFIIKRVKNTVPWILLLVILMVKNLLKRFIRKNCKKKKKKFKRIES